MTDPCPDPSDLSAWIDGELPELQARRLDAHLDTCQACREELAGLQALSATFDALRRPASDPQVATPLFRRVLAVAALLLIGLGTLVTMATDLSREELRFEAYLDRSLDRDVLDVSSLREDELSRDVVVGMLISSSH